jgi:hypothetical protein
MASRKTAMWGMQNLAKIFSKINRPRGERDTQKVYKAVGNGKK